MKTGNEKGLTPLINIQVLKGSIPAII